MAKQFVLDPIFLGSDHIACYLACQNEMDTVPIMEAIWQANKICYLPILIKDGLLSFARYDKGDPLKQNQFFIPEPENISRIMEPDKLELIIAPLLAFDLHGHRLGMGGGYYDRTLAFKQKTPSKTPVLMGLGYAAQQAAILPADPWDILLDRVMTEKTIKIIGSS